MKNVILLVFFPLSLCSSLIQYHFNARRHVRYGFLHFSTVLL